MGPRNATPAEEYASDEEVIGAIGSLSSADNLRISRVSAFRAAALAALGLGMSAEDLMQEAIMRTIKGDRRWRKSVRFVSHLTKTIRSLSSHAPDELRGGIVLPATSEDFGGRLDGVVLTSGLPDAERAAAASEQLGQIIDRFKNDAEVLLVLERLASGMAGPEVQTDLGITQTQYETITTRLRRGIDRREGWRP
jgi:DNA-directed RNA polymerase specialized sigma24 family protein